MKSFEEMTPHFQEKLLSLAVEKYSLKGAENPYDVARSEISRYKPKAYRAWRNKIWYYMQSIDRKRKEQGLEPKYTISTG